MKESRKSVLAIGSAAVSENRQTALSFRGSRNAITAALFFTRVPMLEVGILRVRISSTFSVLPPFLYIRPKLYFDLNLTSTFLAKLYFDQNCTSICTSRTIRSPDLTKCRSTEVEVQKKSN